MLELVGPFAIVAGALAVGGVFKLIDPAPTASMFRSLHLPASLGLARVSGAVEVVVGTAAVLVGGRVLAGVVAVLFVAFTLAMVVLVRQGEAASSCGCFGKLSSRPTAVHLAADAIAAAVALAAAITGVPGLVTAMGEVPLAGIPLVAFAALGTWAFVAVLTVLPEALVAARRTPPAPAVREFHLTDDT